MFEARGLAVACEDGGGVFEGAEEDLFVGVLAGVLVMAGVATDVGVGGLVDAAADVGDVIGVVSLVVVGVEGGEGG